MDDTAQLVRLRDAISSGVPPLELMTLCSGYYSCPKDSNGKRLGPLVGYAGKYMGNDGVERQYVGDVYVNFAKAEHYGLMLRYVAESLIRAHNTAHDFIRFLGAPEGGKALATTLSVLAGGTYIFPEKKITQLASEFGREKSLMTFSRHEPLPKQQFWIVEDICNNFSTTQELIDLGTEYDAQCIGITCFLNRSDKYRETFSARTAHGMVELPIVSLTYNPFPQYRQDDPEVQADIAAGNVIWKPKNQWEPLALAMAKFGS